MRTGVPCNKNRFFPVWKTSQGKPCSGPVLALYRIAVYEIAVYQCHIFVIGAWSFVFNCSIEIAIFYNANDYGSCQQVFPAISMEKHRENLYSSKGKIAYVVGKPCNIYRLRGNPIAIISFCMKINFLNTYLKILFGLRSSQISTKFYNTKLI